MRSLLINSYGWREDQHPSRPPRRVVFPLITVPKNAFLVFRAQVEGPVFLSVAYCTAPSPGLPRPLTHVLLLLSRASVEVMCAIFFTFQGEYHTDWPLQRHTQAQARTSHTRMHVLHARCFAFSCLFVFCISRHPRFLTPLFFRHLRIYLFCTIMLSH